MKSGGKKAQVQEGVLGREEREKIMAIFNREDVLTSEELDLLHTAFQDGDGLDSLIEYTADLALGAENLEMAKLAGILNAILENRRSKITDEGGWTS